MIRLVLALGVAACAVTDPRPRDVASMPRSPLGAWILVSADRELHGELLSVERDAIYVLVWSAPPSAPGAGVPAPVEQPVDVIAVPRRAIRRARLICYNADTTVFWGLGGLLTTPPHLFAALATIPAWIAATFAVEAVENGHTIIDYPDAPLERFADWARFPQGLPPLDPATLLPQPGRISRSIR